MLDSFFVRVPQEAQTDDDRRLVSVMAALSAIAFDHELADLLIEFTAWYGKRQGRPNWIGAAGEHVVCARCSTSFSRHWTNQKYCNEKCATEAQKARERSMRVAFKAMKELNLIQIGD